MDGSPDYEAVERYRKELIAEAASLFGPSESSVATRLINSFCEITPPIEPPIRLRLITSATFGLDGGESRKSGNVTLNWKKLWRDVGETLIDAATALDHPFLFAIVAIRIWTRVRRLETVSLTPDQAVSFAIMWVRCDRNNCISYDMAIEEINNFLIGRGRAVLSKQSFDEALSALESIRAIERSEDNTIWLREWYRTSY